MQASARELKQLTQEEVFDLGVRAQTDSEALTSLTVGFAEALLDIAKYGQKIEQIEREHRRVLELYRRLVARLYGKKSETVDPNQLLLFIKEAFEGEVSKMDCSAPDAPPKPRQKKKPGHGRDHFPDHLPRKRFEIEPKKDDCVCEGCNSALHRFGEEVTERGHLIPGSWVVNQYVRGKWACKKGCSGVVTADLPKTLVDKSRFEPSVAIGAAISKYADHVPLERQAEIHSRVGVDIAPSTLGDAVQNLAELHAQTIDQMRVETLSEPTIHADDTPVKTLIENPAVKEAAISNEKPTPKQKIITEGRVWVYLAMTGKVFYDFTLGKSEKGPAAVLKDFHGKAVVDGAPNFNAGLRAGGATRCGCWSHVRRKFFESLGNMPKPAASMLILINRLFWIERAIQARRRRIPAFGDDAVRKVRRRRSRTLLNRIHSKLVKYQANVPPKESFGEAVAYALSQWASLEVFVDHPDVAIHNNAAERALRAVAVGRKNFLFFGSERGGRTATVLYSLIGTCKLLGLNPHAYLTETTETLLLEPSTPRSEVTPWAWAKKRGDRIALEVEADLAAADAAK